jgi:hypothetical protein
VNDAFPGSAHGLILLNGKLSAGALNRPPRHVVWPFATLNLLPPFFFENGVALAHRFPPGFDQFPEPFELHGPRFGLCFVTPQVEPRLFAFRRPAQVTLVVALAVLRMVYFSEILK